MLAGCATVGTSPGITVAKTTFVDAALPSAPAKGASVIDWSAAVFVHDLRASAANPDDDAQAVKAFRTGKAFLDLQCSAYIDALGSANQAASNERKQVSVIGGLATALMGLTGSEAKDIAIAATTISFAGSSMDAFAGTFLFSDAAKSISKLVGDAQSAYMTSVADNLTTLDYSAAVALLVGYERLCRPSDIRRLIDEAVTAATLVTESPGKLPTDSAIVMLLGQLAGALGQPVSEADAVVLYSWFSKSDRRNDIKTQSPLLTGLLSTPGSTDAALESKLKLPFLPLGIKDHPLALRWATAIHAVPGAAPPVPVAAGGTQAPVADRAAATKRRALIAAPTVTVGGGAGQR